MSLKIALITLVLASMLSPADFLKCYTCAGGQCTEPLTCPPGSDRCMKMNTPAGTVTSCGTQAVCGLAKVNCCDKDLCNGAGTIGKNLLLLLVPVASIFVLS